MATAVDRFEESKKPFSLWTVFAFVLIVALIFVVVAGDAIGLRDIAIVKS